MKWQLFQFWSMQSRWKRDTVPTRSAQTPYLDPGAGGPSRSFLLTHPKAAFNPFDVLFYLIVASKTWTVESLSNDTVLITNLTAFWNSDEFPIIFKKRNTNHYNGLKWHWGCVIAGAGPLHLNVRVVLPLVGVETQKAEEHSYLLEHILGQTASPFPPNSSILSPNGKTVSVTPQKIISSPPRPAPFSLTFCLILFSMQGITLPEIPEMSNNKSKNWRNEKHGFPSAPQIMRRLGCLAPRRPKHLENWLLACYPDVWTLWEIVVLSFGAQHKTKDIQNKQNTQITSSTSFVRNVLELGFLFWVCGYGIIPSFSLLYEVQIGHKTW